MLKFQKKNKYLDFLKETSSTFDLFAQPPTFRILNQNKFTTVLGHIFTLSIAALCTTYFFFSIRDLINQSSPSVVFQEVQLIDSDPIYLNKQNFTFAITLSKLSLGSLGTYNIDYQLQVQNCFRKRNVDPITGALINITQTCFNYSLERCQNDKHFVTKQQKEYFANINLTYVQCLNSEQWDQRPLVLQGTTVGISYQYIVITATTCKNSTTITSCHPPDQITQGLQSGYYAVYISDTLSQFNNPGVPFSPIIQLSFTTFSITSSKEMFQFFRYTKTITDEGLVFQENKETSAIVQTSISQSQNIYNNLYFVYHVIALDQKGAVYQRSYPKLQQILGSLGGFWQVLYFITQLLIGPMIYTMMNLQMANKIFSFVHPQEQIVQSPLLGSEVDGQGTPPISQRQLVQKLNKKDNKSSIFRNQSINSQQTVNDTNQMKIFIKKRNQSLYLGFKEIFLIFFGCRKKEKQLINYATEKILSKLDIEIILKQLFEIDKLKNLLLNDEQLKLFHYLPKPNIPINLFDSQNDDKIKQLESIPQFQFILQEEKTDFVKITEAYQSYRVIKQKNDLNQIDQLLIQQLDQDVLKLFYHIDRGNTRIDQLISDQIIDQVFNDSVKSKGDIEENVRVSLPQLNRND
ncbi:hypothetical protein pb186bvf_018299 [Paramecium bursaria]